jgi:hypothetical protein
MDENEGEAQSPRTHWLCATGANAPIQAERGEPIWAGIHATRRGELQTGWTFISDNPGKCQEESKSCE